MRRPPASGVAVALGLLVAALVRGAWAGGPALGQTIPWPTDTPPRPTATASPVRTWTPLPTWTLSPTSVPSGPTAPPEPAAAHGTPLPAATATQTPAPAPLALAAQAEPAVAGPGDAVRFTVRVANVGRTGVGDVRLVAELPPDLLAESAECGGCPVSLEEGSAALAVGALTSGGQAIATLTAVVRDWAWPGQTLRTRWRAAAPGTRAEEVEVAVELPWAELPATGGPTAWRQGPETLR